MFAKALGFFLEESDEFFGESIEELMYLEDTPAGGVSLRTRRGFTEMVNCSVECVLSRLPVLLWRRGE